MHTSDQSPEELSGTAQPTESGAKIDHQDAEKPSANAWHGAIETSIDHEAVRQGRIYPPPPSFYEREEVKEPAQAGSSWVPVPPQGSPQANSSTSSGRAEYIPLPQAHNPPVPSYPPQHAFPPYPSGQNYSGPQAPYLAPQKKSYRWVWILVSVLGVLILASCGVCAWASSSLFGSTFQQTTTALYSGRDLTNNYYEAIQNKRYSQAYSYLSLQRELKSLTPVQYLKQAQELDEQYGPVYKYVAGTPAVSYDTSGTDINHFTVSVDVTREKKSYQVLLTMYKINDQWKITDYTTI
jgi:flagellar basal body-associated protein FliL